MRAVVCTLRGLRKKLKQQLRRGLGRKGLLTDEYMKRDKGVYSLVLSKAAHIFLLRDSRPVILKRTIQIDKGANNKWQFLKYFSRNHWITESSARIQRPATL